MSSTAGPVFPGQMLMAVQPVPVMDAAGFANHPGFSHVISAFPTREMMYETQEVESDGVDSEMESLGK